MWVLFLSTPSARRATWIPPSGGATIVEFLSTPSARRATGKVPLPDLRGQISIHALCEEGDSSRAAATRTRTISIHALCEEGDLPVGLHDEGVGQFLSTPSARRATPESEAEVIANVISIHALCEEGDRVDFDLLPVLNVFLSTPSARRATRQPRGSATRSIFLSTPSARRATSRRAAHIRPLEISIHALCEEGDVPSSETTSVEGNFYPRPLRGGRLSALILEIKKFAFLSTPSARRATAPFMVVSIDAGDFYPRPLRGGRRFADLCFFLFVHFYPRPLRGGRRGFHCAAGLLFGNFYPRPLRGGRPEGTCEVSFVGDFYPRPLRGGRRPDRFFQSGGELISIHALCEEGDRARSLAARDRAISIHALCEEGDPLQAAGKRGSPVFLSTPSARRATLNAHAERSSDGVFLSTPSARRATGATGIVDPKDNISIHALCEEGDFVNISLRLCEGQFLSTPSARRATTSTA